MSRAPIVLLLTSALLLGVAAPAHGQVDTARMAFEHQFGKFARESEVVAAQKLKESKDAALGLGDRVAGTIVEHEGHIQRHAEVAGKTAEIIRDYEFVRLSPPLDRTLMVIEHADEAAELTIIGAKAWLRTRKKEQAAPQNQTAPPAPKPAPVPAAPAAPSQSRDPEPRPRIEHKGWDRVDERPERTKEFGRIS